MKQDRITDGRKSVCVRLSQRDVQHLARIKQRIRQLTGLSDDVSDCTAVRYALAQTSIEIGASEQGSVENEQEESQRR